MLTGRKKSLFFIVFIFTIFLNLLFIGNSKADPPAPFVITGPNQMSINQTQALSVSGGCGGPFIWSLSGGGSLSGTTGSSVNYTSPANNANCDNTPIICVTDSAGEKVYKQISVKAYTAHDANAYVNYYEIGPIYAGWSCTNDWNAPTVVYTFQPHYCDGTSHNSFANKQWGYSCADARSRIYDMFKDIYFSDGYYQGSHDLRSPAMIAARCCPAATLPPPPQPVTVAECRTCDLKIENFNGSSTTIDPQNGGAITFDAQITSSKPFIWTLTITGKTPDIKPINGSGNPNNNQITWNGKDANGDVVYPGSYTATLSARVTDDPTCNDTKDKSFTVKAREKDCKLDVAFDSSINIASGNLSHAQTLFNVPNSKLIADFTLTYNSTDGYSGILGAGWSHNYNIFLMANPDDDSYVLMDGRGGRISLYNNGSYYSSDMSVYPLLQKNADNTFTLTYKNGTIYIFDTQGKLTAIADKNSNAVNLAYGSGGNLVNITDASGRIISLSYDANNRISSITDPNNNSYAFTYSGNTLTQVSAHNALGTQTWRYTYDDKAFMLTKTDPQGNLVQYSYDAEHRVNQSIDPQGRIRNVQYDPVNKTTTVTEKDGGIWVYKYDPDLGALTSKTDPAGGTSSYEYDANRNMTSRIEADGSATTYTYDDNGNMTSVSDALGNTTTYTYNEQNLVTGITDATGRQTKYSYDARGNILSTTDPSGATTQYAYDNKGNITAITGPNGGITTMTYDTNNNLISITDPGGQTTTQTYDSLGNMVSQTDAAGTKTTFQYNSLNQLIAVTDSAGKITQYTYDARGNRLSSTDANGNTTRYDYNYKNQLIQTIDAAGFATAFTYGSGGCSSCGGGSDKLTAVTDAKNQTTTYQYDQTGRLIKETDPLGNFTSYTYDAKGNMISKTKPDGHAITYIYDDLNRLVERDYPNNTSDVYQYDQAGNMTGATNQNIVYYYSYDTSNRMTGVTSYNLAQIFNIEYQYDIMGNRKVMTLKEGTSTPRVINYEYNTSNQMTKIISDTTGSYTFAYDSLGRRIKRTLPNDSYTTYAYDPLSRLTGMTHKNAFNQTIDSFGYTYDNVGNRMTKTIKEGLPHTISYNYDNVYRLTKSMPQSRNKIEKLLDDIIQHNTEAYSYDPVGNRQTGPKAHDSYTYDSGNELLTAREQHFKNNNYEYDVNGNIIKKTETIGHWKTITSYTYDDENRLIYVTIQKGDKVKEISFAYDPFGRRISKTIEREEFTDDDDDKDNGKDNHHENDKDNHHDNDNDKGKDKGKHGHDDYPKTTFYIYDGQNIIAEYDQNNKQTASYIHGPNIDEPLSAEIRNTRIYYHADGLGSITTLTNHMGHKVQTYAYDSFGNIKSTPFWIKQPYTYTGREFDYDTGLYYYRARYYNPMAGRFITRDPIGFGGGDVNLYAYVGNNPANRNDPTGESAKACVRRFAFGPIAYVFPPRHCYVMFNDEYTDTLSYDGSVGDDSAPYTWFKRCHKIEPKEDCGDECTDVKIKQAMMKCANQKYRFFGNNCCDCVRSALEESGCKVPLGINITNFGF